MAKKKASPHYHIWNLPKRIFPRKKGNKASKYAQDIRRTYQGLTYTNSKLQASGQVCMFYIASITKKHGYSVRPEEVFREIETFANNYENFCYRIFSMREKLMHFVNEVLPVGFSDHNVKAETFMTHPILKDARVFSQLEKFRIGNSEKPNILGQLISNRNSLTHKLYYYEHIDHYMRPLNLSSAVKPPNKAWFKEWRKHIESHAEQAIKAMDVLGDINHEISNRLVAYKMPAINKRARRKVITKVGKGAPVNPAV